MNKSGLPDALREKNDQEFIEITIRIQNALSQIEGNPKLKASQGVLAQLAKCSRGTLNNRKWPLEKLRAIKHARKSPSRPTEDPKSSIKTQTNQIERYKQQLHDSREELLTWKTRHDEIAERLTQTQELNKVLQSRNKELEDMTSARPKASVIKLTKPSIVSNDKQ
jgi:hypothetical protein